MRSVACPLYSCSCLIRTCFLSKSGSKIYTVENLLLQIYSLGWWTIPTLAWWPELSSGLWKLSSLSWLLEASWNIIPNSLRDLDFWRPRPGRLEVGRARTQVTHRKASEVAIQSLAGALHGSVFKGSPLAVRRFRTGRVLLRRQKRPFYRSKT